MSVEVDKYGIPLSDWWCVTDYYQTTVLYSVGLKGSIMGERYFRYVCDEQTARKLWEKYNELQRGKIGGITYYGCIKKYNSVLITEPANIFEKEAEIF